MLDRSNMPRRSVCIWVGAIVGAANRITAVYVTGRWTGISSPPVWVLLVLPRLVPRDEVPPIRPPVEELLPRPVVGNPVKDPRVEPDELVEVRPVLPPVVVDRPPVPPLVVL
jgi:hypothetical protein